MACVFILFGGLFFFKANCNSIPQPIHMHIINERKLLWINNSWWCVSHPTHPSHTPTYIISNVNSFNLALHQFHLCILYCVCVFWVFYFVEIHLLAPLSPERTHTHHTYYTHTKTLYNYYFIRGITLCMLPCPPCPVMGGKRLKDNTQHIYIYSYELELFLPHSNMLLYFHLPPLVHYIIILWIEWFWQIVIHELRISYPKPFFE